MYEELVKRLRKRAVNLKEKFSRNAELLSELMQAADAIEELNLIAKSHERSAARWAETAKAAVEQIPCWIPVTERLPDYPGRFMCYYENEVNAYGEIGHCIDWGRYDPDDGWFASGVTHWMPLPEPPEEEV